jgi:phage terminase small subunit
MILASPSGLYPWPATCHRPPRPAIRRPIVAAVIRDTAYHLGMHSESFGLEPSFRSVLADVFVREEPDEDEDELDEDDG